MGWIYRITNTKNNKIYIGKTITSISDRWSKHLYEAFNPKCKGYNFLLHKAIRKYGKESFIIESVEYLQEDRLLSSREQYWIECLNSLLPNGYNMTFGGEGSIKIDRKQVYELWDQGLSAVQISKKIGCSDTTARNILRNYDKYTPQENLNRSPTKGFPPRSDKIVYQYDKNTGGLITSFPSIKMAAESVGVDRSCISRVCSGKKKTSANFIWKFEKLSPLEVLKTNE